MASSDSEKLNGDVFQAKGREARKYAREDFDFEKILGEGSYSTVSSCGACLLVCDAYRYTHHVSMPKRGQDLI